MTKGNKNPTTRIVNIPAQFLPLIESEMQHRGCFSMHECMGHILKEYFGTKGLLNPQQDDKIVLKGEKINA